MNKAMCPQIMVSAALLLACKVEEQPKTVLKVIDAVFKTAFRGRTTALDILSKQVCLPTTEMLHAFQTLPTFPPAVLHIGALHGVGY